MKKALVKITTLMMAAVIMFGLNGMVVNANSYRCIHSGCNNKTVSGSNYCSTHKCKKSGCTNCGLKKYGGYCSSSHQNKSKSLSSSSSKKGSYNSSTSKKSSYSSTTSKKSSSSTSKRNYEMPDCDDYEDYDDFMDEWDGYMPDGSDAEDYWDNW